MKNKAPNISLTKSISNLTLFMKKFKYNFTNIKYGSNALLSYCHVQVQFGLPRYLKWL